MLPPEIMELAFRSGDEYAWKRDDIAEVVAAMTEAQLAIMGGEVWGVMDVGILSMLKLKDGRTAVFSWDTGMKHEQESWEDFVDRCCVETLTAIRDLNVEQEVIDEHAGSIYYSLTWFDQSDYESLFEDEDDDDEEDDD